MEIISFNQLDTHIQKQYTEEIKAIFFECTSVKNFRDEEHRATFFNKWCGDYLKLSPRNFYLAISANEVAGYLSGHLDSELALSEFEIPGAAEFTEYYEQYPAHFHINCAPRHQGKGIGRKLIEHYVSRLSESSIEGVHLITSTDANNLGFYRALGFDKEILRPFNKVELLLMGREISA
ncbi:hypothetical protein A9Q84_07025 [Halobacteriovorax marinus]|uniref:N-acetyltransferase domain-containing protein n=1 Tax=Halobacteriovorax marinus TaxID=97084 RepID=A0A1Y5F9Y3_9BACT|nr:hypothetical protein A9Q84_07025 [Halobacteriovorax marinus]